MTLRKFVEKKLEEEPNFRERRNKDQGLISLLNERSGYPHYTTDGLIALVQDYASADRYWRMILKERPELRGRDYDDKRELEYQKQRDLGYNVPSPITKEQAPLL